MSNRFQPTEIVGGVRDFIDYMRADRPHRWPALGLAVVVPLVVFYFIARSINPEDEPKRTIIYVESWTADRSEYDVRRAWLQRAREANERNRRRRDAYGTFARGLGQDYDVNAAHDEFDQALADIAQAEADVDAAEAAGVPIPVRPPRDEPRRAPATAAPTR